MSFFAELQRRNVIRVALAYVVSSWVLIQVMEVATEAFGAPGWVLKVFITFLALGFLPALFVSWVYELTPEGMKKESEIPPESAVVAHTAKKLDVVIIVLLIVALGLLAADRFLWPHDATENGENRGQTPISSEQAASGRAIGNRSLTPVSPADTQPRAIAVLPFTDMSPESDQGYFADGISEEILNLLAKNPELRVVARTSAFKFRGDQHDLREVGETLGADRILEGSVRSAGNRVRITAQLIDAANGYHLWSETYDRDLTDIFAVQDEIAGAITEELGIHLGVASSAQAGVGADADAYRLYLKGREALNQRATPGRLQDAIDLLARAVALDPDMAVAHGALTLTWGLSSWYTNTSRPEAYRLSLASAERALAIDPENVEALVGKGYTLAYLGYDPMEGKALIEQALELRPNDVTANNLMGDIYRLIGDRDNAIRYETRAVELDPLNAVHQWDLGWAYAEVGEDEAAMPYFRRSLELEPRNPFAMSGVVWSLMFTEGPEVAKREFDRFVATGDYDGVNWALDHVTLALVMGDWEDVDRAYRAAMASLEAQGAAPGFRATLAYIAGDLPRASELLQQAIDERDASWLTARNLSIKVVDALAEAGYPVNISDQFRHLYELQRDSDVGRFSARERILALRDDYRGS